MTTITRDVLVDGNLVRVATRDPSVAASPRMVHTGGEPAIAAASGNDTTPSVTETYLAEIYVPDTVTVTGIALFNSHVVGNFGAGKLTSQTYGAMPGATMPTTFTTALGPIASLY